MKVLALLTISLLFILINARNEEQIYRVTEECLQCLRSLDMFDEEALADIEDREYVTLDYVLSLANGRRLRNLSTSGAANCLNSYGETQSVTTQDRLEKQIHNKIISMGTECSDKISGYYNKDRSNWKSEVCSSYFKNKGDCISELDSEEIQFLNESCDIEAPEA